MKFFLLFLLGLSLILSVSAQRNVAVSNNELPSPIKSILDKKFPDWRFPNVPNEIYKAAKEYAQFSQVNLVRGDFDGNGQLDYALQIEQGNLFKDKGEKIGLKYHLVAFLKNDGGYKFYVVADADSGGGDYLLLSKKGSKLYNYETQRNFILKTDAFEIVIFEKAATTYIFEKGRFRAIVTGD